MPCPGDENLLCGGSKAFDLYQLVQEGTEERVEAASVVSDPSLPLASGNAAIADAVEGIIRSGLDSVVALSFEHEGCFHIGGTEVEDLDGELTFASLGMTPEVSAAHDVAFQLYSVQRPKYDPLAPPCLTLTTPSIMSRMFSREGQRTATARRA